MNYWQVMLLKSLLTNKYIFLLFFALLPSIDQLVTHYLGYYVGFVLRILTHIGIPLLIARPIVKKLYSSFSKKAAITSTIFVFGTIVLLAGLYLLLKNTFDSELLRSQLALIYEVTPASYLFVGLLICFINPFLEETYWRAFLYGKTRILFGGVLFAVHHAVMMASWFASWQLAIIVIGLCAVGILFNWLVKFTDSIWPAILVHMSADIVIIIIGYLLLF